tara:strand:- start:286 stop:792 length:507 start_codon:yes stop_codon:yes gene_type:complete
MSLGKHLPGYTVDDKGRTIVDLIELYDDKYQATIDPCLADWHSTCKSPSYCDTYANDIVNHIVNILDNYGIPKVRSSTVSSYPEEKIMYYDSVCDDYVIVIRLFKGIIKIKFNGHCFSKYSTYRIRQTYSEYFSKLHHDKIISTLRDNMPEELVIYFETLINSKSRHF